MEVDRTSIRIRRLSSIDDYAMRAAVFRDFLRSLSHSELSDLFQHLENGLRNQRAHSRSIVHSLFLYWSSHWQEWMDRFAQLPSSDLVVNLRHQTQFSPLEAWKTVEPNANLFADDKVLTLGERRAHARQPQRKMIETYLFDPDQQVVRNLLHNAKITEHDVVRIAVRRPTTGVALVSVFESTRFGLSKKVMMALLQNPYLPYRVGLGLVFLMSKADLRKLRAVQSLSPTIKQFIGHRFKQLA